MTETEMSNLLKVNNAYNKELKKYIQGTLPWQKVIYLGNHFGEASKYFGNSPDLYMSQSIWNKALKGHSTTIDLKKLEDLPLKIAQAPLIFKSKKQGSIVAAINVTDSTGQPVVVAINTLSKSLDGKNSINAITSIHGRPAEQLTLWSTQGLELHNSIQKETSILSKCYGVIPSLDQNRGFKETSNIHPEQLGAIPSVEMNKGFKDTANVTPKSEPTKTLAVKMADLTKKNTDKLRKSLSNNQLKSKGRGL
jgi:hypothetical protein